MEDVLARVWENLGGRIGGPLTFRLVLQPIMATILAVKAGLQDARDHRPAYFWAILTSPDGTARNCFSQGWKAVAKIFVLAIVIDLVYQVIVFRWVYPGELLNHRVSAGLCALSADPRSGQPDRGGDARGSSGMTSPSGALDTGTRLAYERTRLASERNMMAWIRTATSLISFGFTVYKFFQFEAGKSMPAATGFVISPRVFALIIDRDRPGRAPAQHDRAPAEHQGVRSGARRGARVGRRRPGSDDCVHGSGGLCGRPVRG